MAAGVFAPGHLGELTWQVPFELVDAVLEETRTRERRLRVLPSRTGVYFVLALIDGSFLSQAGGLAVRVIEAHVMVTCGWQPLWRQLPAGACKP